LDVYAARSRQVINDFNPSRMAQEVWRDTGNCIVPWVKHDDLPYGEPNVSLPYCTKIVLFLMFVPRSVHYLITAMWPLPLRHPSRIHRCRRRLALYR
jgi:hypothetical protein